MGSWSRFAASCGVGEGLPVPSRRTLPAAILASGRSMLATLSASCLRLPATPSRLARATPRGNRCYCGFRAALLGIVCCVAASGQAATVLVEAESFAEHGGWSLDTQFIREMGSPYLLAHGLGKREAPCRSRPAR